MGNHMAIKEGFKSNHNSFFIKDTFSSYKGEVSEPRSNSNTSASNSTINKFLFEEENLNSNLIPYTFAWKEGGEKVFLIGSFSGWNIKHLMVNEDDEFTIEMVNLSLKLVLTDWNSPL